MSFGEESGTDIDFSTMRGREYPTLRQYTVFLENRVGRLLEVIRRFEHTPSRIVAMNIHDSTECSIVRFILTHPEQGREILERAGLAMIESDLIGVQLPYSNQPLIQVFAALLHAEVNLVQIYPLMVRPECENTVVALMCDNIELAQQVLVEEGFDLVSENDLLEMH